MVKKQIANLLSRILTVIHSWIRKLNIPADNPHQTYQSLAPKTLTDKQSEIYIQAIKEGIERKNIKNIAVSGAYGSGKSSVIKTFAEKYKNEYRILPISLASFETDEETKKGGDFQKLIELSILQQIFYHVSPSKIPDSRFKRISNFSNSKIFFYSLGLVLWFICATLIYRNNLLVYINPKTWTYKILDVDIETLGILTIFFVGLNFMMGKLIKFLYNSKVNRINLKGEIELGKELKESILNEHLDEVLYFFERNPYDLVIIEDLDRFDNVEIFAKLREINTLINNSQQIQDEIVFLYAVRDDIFKGNERTKFFDFIIPIIPVINPSNSNEILKRLRKQLPKKEQPSKVFLDDISILIKDMRMLFNIWNEYLIYKNVLKTKLSQDNLLAIIIYKNFYPDDFISLHNREGVLFSLMNYKNHFVRLISDEYKSELEIYQSKILQLESLFEKSIEELKSIYISAVFKLFDKPYLITIDSNQYQYNFNQLYSDVVFSNLRKSKNIGYYSLENRVLQFHDVKKSFSDIEDVVNPSMSFEDREKLINENTDKHIEALKRKLDSKQQTLDKIRSFKMSELLNYKPKNKFLEDWKKLMGKDIEEPDDLILNLVKNGYIDEHYYYYISYFYDESLSLDEYYFIQNVLNGEPSPFEFKIENIETVINRIQENYFGTKAILNISLLNGLFVRPKYEKKLKLMISVLGDESEESKQFIDLFFDQAKFKNAFIKKLAKSWPVLWGYIEQSVEFTPKKKIDYLKAILSGVDSDTILELAKNSKLEEFISHQDNFLNWIVSSVELEKINPLLKDLEVKFEKLSFPENDSSKNVFHYIVEKSLYKINPLNISTIIAFLSNESTYTDIKSSNFTQILRTENVDFISHIYQNIKEYLTEVWFEYTNNEEEESAIQKMFEETDLNEEIKRRVMISSGVKIKHLSIFQDFENKRLALEMEQLEMNWINILDYYKALDGDKLDDTLIEFLNNDEVAQKLSKLDIDIDDEERELEDTLALAILYEEDINAKSFQLLLPKLPILWDSVKVEKLSQEKVIILITQKYLSLNQENFNQLKEFHPNLHLVLLEHNWTQFIISIDDYLLNDEESNILLRSEKLSNKNKADLVFNLEDFRIEANEKLSEVALRILAGEKSSDLSYNRLLSLFKNDSPNESKLLLLTENFQNLSDIELVNLVSSLGGKYDELFKKQHKPKLKNSPLNKLLVEELEKRYLIIRSEEIGKEIKVFALYT